MVQDLLKALQGQQQTQSPIGEAKARQLQAQLLLQNVQKTDNPLIAALGGFLGAHNLGQATTQLGQFEEQEALRKRKLEQEKLVPSDIRQFEQFQQMTPEQQQQFVDFTKQTAKPGTVVNVGQQLESEFTKAKAKAQGTQAAELETKIFDAADSIRASAGTRANLARALRESDTGPTAGARGTVLGLANDLGIDVDISDAANVEQIRAAANSLVIPRVKQLGTRPTDKDLEVITSTLSGLGKTNESNLALLDLDGQIADRQLAFESILIDMPRGASRREIQKAFNQYTKKNPFKAINMSVPKSKGEAVVGDRYIINGNIFVWTGDEFVERKF